MFALRHQHNRKQKHSSLTAITLTIATQALKPQMDQNKKSKYRSGILLDQFIGLLWQDLTHQML